MARHSRQEPHPLKLPVVRAVFAVVLHVVPHAERDSEKLVAQLLGVGDGVRLAAQLDSEAG